MGDVRRRFLQGAPRVAVRRVLAVYRPIGLAPTGTFALSPGRTAAVTR
jgi:hypothetical protein